MNNLKQYSLAFVEIDTPTEELFAFWCLAESHDHAVALCEQVNPGVSVEACFCCEDGTKLSVEEMVELIIATDVNNNQASYELEDWYASVH